MKSKKKVWVLGGGVGVFFAFALLFISLPPKGHVPILMYHFVYPDVDVKHGKGSLNIGVDEFELQMWFLKTFGYRTISLDDLYAIKTGQVEPQGREIVVTFDDGHSTYLTRALPILRRYGIKSANFLIWDHLNLGWSDFVSLQAAKDLAGDPLVILGAHTLSHRILTELEPKEMEAEIVQSKRKLEEALGKPVHYFCYPTGVFNEEVMNLVGQAGYRLAFTTSRKRLNHNPETLYSLTRIKIKPNQGLFVFWANVSGLSGYAKELSVFFSQLTGNGSSGKLNVYEPAPKTM
ncbi:MAG: polysaccharide deacetylase family protein [Candidatus Omnitrophica bacterium]|nr:polysaccharide deacetylase family protein [Candidatus Omnitrophota bacterium]